MTLKRGKVCNNFGNKGIRTKASKNGIEIRKIKRRVDHIIPLDPIGSFSITLQPSSYDKIMSSLDLNTDSHVLEVGRVCIILFSFSI